MRRRTGQAFALALVIGLAWQAPTASAQGGSVLGTPQYQAPDPNAPSRRVGGHARGAGDPRPTIAILAPIRTGRTVDEQPTLYWYLSDRTSHPIEVSLIDGESVEPLLEFRIEAPVEAGIHALRLADYGIRLKRGQVYEWFVAFISNPDKRSKDVVSGGAIERVSRSERLNTQLAVTARDNWPRIYAEEGLWYDALATLSRAIKRAPESAELHAWRAALMEQVDLSAVAAFDRKSADTSAN